MLKKYKSKYATKKAKKFIEINYNNDNYDVSLPDEIVEECLSYE